MSDTHNYPAEIERDEDGRFVVAFPDFGWGATDGATRDEALAEARDLLRELIAVTMREGEDLPEPSEPLGGRRLSSRRCRLRLRRHSTKRFARLVCRNVVSLKTLGWRRVKYGAC